MNYAAIKYTDVANGPGVRVSLYVSGCTRHCPGCFNPETWDFNYGNEFTEEVQEQILEALRKPYIKGFSLLGGEPFEPANRPTLAAFLRRVKAVVPGKDVWCYSGNSFAKDLRPDTDPNTQDMLKNIDILVDGDFVMEEKNPNLRFKGSANQHIIQVQPSLKGEEIVLWEGDEQIEKLKKEEAGAGLSKEDACGCGC